MAATLASSPIGRVHLAEYALLAVLVVRALPGPPGAPHNGAGFLIASAIGLADETVQYFLPNRVFDWYDVALNVGASLLGVLTLAWWSFAGKPSLREPPPGGAGGGDGPGEGSG